MKDPCRKALLVSMVFLLMAVASGQLNDYEYRNQEDRLDYQPKCQERPGNVVEYTSEITESCEGHKCPGDSQRRPPY